MTEAVTTRMLGVLSNSGGRADTVSAAVAVFRTGGAENILHLGDIGGRHVLEALSVGGWVLDRLTDIHFRRWRIGIITAMGAIYVVQAVILIVNGGHGGGPAL